MAPEVVCGWPGRSSADGPVVVCGWPEVVCGWPEVVCARVHERIVGSAQSLRV